MMLTLCDVEFLLIHGTCYNSENIPLLQVFALDLHI